MGRSRVLPRRPRCGANGNAGRTAGGSKAACATPTKFWAWAGTPPPDQIRAAYRKLAKTSHPDLHPGDKAAEERFKEVSAANELLSDEEKRRQYDRGEIDASGAPRMREQSYRDYRGEPRRRPLCRRRLVRERGRPRGDDPGPVRGPRRWANHEDARRRCRLPARGRPRRRRPRRQDPDHAGRPVQRRGDHPARRRSGAGAAPEGQGLARDRRRPARRRADRDPGPRRIRPSSARVPTSTWPCRSRWARRSAAPRSPCRRCTGAVAMTIPKNSTTGAVLRLKGKGLPDAAGGATRRSVCQAGGRPAGARPIRRWSRRSRTWEAAHPYDPRAALMREARA